LHLRLLLLHGVDYWYSIILVALADESMVGWGHGSVAGLALGITISGR
jgi:hypothetical protein